MIVESFLKGFGVPINNHDMMRCRYETPSFKFQRQIPKLRACSRTLRASLKGKSGETHTGQNLQQYIEHVLSSEKEELSSAHAPTIADGDTSSGGYMGSSSDAEVEELRQVIDSLTSANESLQNEMERVLSGLASVIKEVKHSSKSKLINSSHVSNGKQQLAASQPTLSNPVDESMTPSIQSPTTVSCVVQHPGALACTQTTFQADPLNQKYTIQMQTTASATDAAAPQSVLSLDELGALAAQSLLSSASQALRERTRELQAQTPSDTQARRMHLEICHLLLTGEIIEAKRNSIVSPFGHESFIIILKDIHNNRRIKAIFKPRVLGDADGWHRAPCEWVAYKLNLLLGMDRVPPTAYRTDIRMNVDGECLEYKEGAIMYFVEDATSLAEVSEEQWGCSKEELLSDTRILDVLLVNSDRHSGHFLFGRHWCRGHALGEEQQRTGQDAPSHKNNDTSNKNSNGDASTRKKHRSIDAGDGRQSKSGGDLAGWLGDKHVILIDHAAAFRAGADVNMQHENAFMTGPVCCVSAKTYLRLRFLDYTTIAGEFSGVLSEDELRGMAKRRDSILKYLDKLVAERGYANVVRE